VTISFVSAAYSNTYNGAHVATVVKTVTDGNLVVAIALWEGATTTVSISDGTSTFTNGTAGVNPDSIDGEWDIRQCPAYLLSANGGNKTFTLTLGGDRNTVVLHILEFSTNTSGGSWELDGQAAYEYGYSAALSSGNLTTIGTEVVGIGYGRNWTNSSYSSQTIGGYTATEAVDNGVYSGNSFYYIGTFSGDADTTAGVSMQWLQGLIAFKVSAVAGKSIPIHIINPAYTYAPLLVR
jgi:hypothetical protein